MTGLDARPGRGLGEHALVARSHEDRPARLEAQRVGHLAGHLGRHPLAVAVAASLALHVVVIYLPILQAAFHTVPLSLADWLIAAGAAATLLVATELAKWAVRARASRRVGLTVSK